LLWWWRGIPVELATIFKSRNQGVKI